MKRLCCLLVLVPVATLAAQDDARALVKKAIEARGGEDKLLKLKVVREKTKGKILVGDGGSIPFTGESMVHFPSLYRMTITAEIMGKEYSQTRVLNGAKAWVVNIKGEKRDLAGKE